MDEVAGGKLVDSLGAFGVMGSYGAGKLRHVKVEELLDPKEGRVGRNSL